jgi:hypothetical protein
MFNKKNKNFNLGGEVFVMSLVLLLMFSSYIPGITMGLF